MPNIASAKKALRVSKKRQKVNLRITKEYKVQIKDLKEAKNKKEALSKVYSKLDSAAKKGVIHKKKAARLKSKATRLLKTQEIEKTKKTTKKIEKK